MKFFTPFELPVAPVFPDRFFDIRDYGAKGGTDFKSTDAIAKAIADCSESGGGHVIIPKGEWLSGAIHLKDNVDLHFEEGALLHFSEDFNDYLPVVYGILGGNRCYSPSHFLYAYKCKNIAVTGKGTLDGHGKVWWPMKNYNIGMQDLMKKGKALAPLSERVYDKPEQGVRPRMLQFVECENVLIEGITMKNSPSWTVHPAWCKNIIVRCLVIRNPVDSPNTDGVNLESCKRGLVERLDVETGDDVCCLKAGRDEDAWDAGIPCEDIEIRNCVSSGGHGGFTVGSETSACIRNAYIHDCHFEGNLYSAVRFKTMKGRGGVVENIDCENITATKTTSAAVYITMRYTGEKLDDQSKPIENMPKMRNISISGVKCEKAACGIKLCGERGYDLENIYLSDIDVAAEVPIDAMNVSGLHMENVKLREMVSE